MDATQMDAEPVIASYLAGRLPESESDAFEQYVSDHPEICREIEQTLRFKEGLARLRERGELNALLRTAAPRRWIPYAAAASVALATLAGVLWLQLRGPATEMLFLSPNEVAARHHEPAAILGSYVLARTRGSAGVAEVRLPARAGAIELRIVPSGVSPETRYSVSFNRLNGSAAGSRLGLVDAGPAAPDGYVTIYVDGSQLTRGDYEVTLTSAVPKGTNTVSDRFVVRVQ
jgi:hypothetical protein